MAKNSKQFDVYRSPNSDQYWAYETDAEYYDLLDATVWVGAKGKVLHSEIADRIFDDNWASELYLHLSKGLLVATGLDTKTRLREEIPSVVWEGAYRAEETQDGHRIEFVPVENGGFSAQLTLFDRDSPQWLVEPRWTGIRIDGKALRNAFDRKPKRTIADETKCRDWLSDIIGSSPLKKTHKKDDLKEVALEDFNVSERFFLKIWKEIIEQHGATEWSKPGAPKNRE